MPEPQKALDPEEKSIQDDIFSVIYEELRRLASFVTRLDQRYDQFNGTGTRGLAEVEGFAPPARYFGSTFQGDRREGDAAGTGR